MQQSCPMPGRHPKAGLHQLAARLLFWSRAPVYPLQLPACQSLNSRWCITSSLTRLPMTAWCAVNPCHLPQQAVPPQTWMRSHTGAGDSAGVSTPAVADPLPCATAAVPCCRGRGATYTSQPPTSRTRSAGTAAETLSVSIALLRTQKGNGCPTATTPTCKSHGSIWTTCLKLSQQAVAAWVVQAQLRLHCYWHQHRQAPGSACCRSDTLHWTPRPPSRPHWLVQRWQSWLQARC